MYNITKTFSATGNSNEILIKKGSSLIYRADLSSDWDGTLVLRKTTDGGLSYSIVATITADVTGTIIEVTVDANYQFYCSVFTAGTADITLADANDSGVARDVSGSSSLSTVTAYEQWDGFSIRKTRLQLASVPVTIISVTTGAGVGGTKIYDLPEGRILMLGCMADLSIEIATAKQADFTDATPEGDIGIGTVAPANADALGTDATDDDFSTAAAFTMAAYADASVQCPSEASLQFNGVSTPTDMYLNVLVDAADIDNDATTEVLVSGIIQFYWINLGDF